MSPFRAIADRAKLLRNLQALTANPEHVELVASLVKGSRATFNIQEAALLLSVSPKHLYANISHTGQAGDGLDVIRSGDRMMIAAHQLRARIGLRDPHNTHIERTPLELENLPPQQLCSLAEVIALTVLCRLEAAGALTFRKETNELARV